MISTTNLIIILVVVILLFGAKRIPEIAKGLGRAMHEFKKAKDDIARESNELLSTAEKHAAVEEKAPGKDNGKPEKPDAV